MAIRKIAKKVAAKVAPKSAAKPAPKAEVKAAPPAPPAPEPTWVYLTHPDGSLIVRPLTGKLVTFRLYRDGRCSMEPVWAPLYPDMTMAEHKAALAAEQGD